MICQSFGCGIVAWAVAGLVALLCVYIVAIGCNVAGIAVRAAPRYAAFWRALPLHGRLLWRAAVISCAVLLMVFGLAVSFLPDLWGIAVWLSGLVGPVLLTAAVVAVLWASIRSPNRLD